MEQLRSSEHAVYYIRYRDNRLAWKCFRLVKEDSDGVAIIVRFPDDEFSENALTYYVVSKAGLQVPGGVYASGPVDWWWLASGDF